MMRIYQALAGAFLAIFALSMVSSRSAIAQDGQPSTSRRTTDAGAAQVSPDVGNPGAATMLQWKFVAGKPTHYTHDEEKIIRQLGGSDSSEYRVRTTYDYRWDFISDINDLKAIAVTFDRIRFTVVEPTEKITIDTDAPLDPHHSDPAASRLQSEAYRILQTRFVFLAAPNGGIVWPEALTLGRPGPEVQLPLIFRTPTGSNFFTPDSFTSGDAVALPDKPVKAGDEWTSRSHSAYSRIAGWLARYTLAGQAQKMGHQCWHIKGITKQTIGDSGDETSANRNVRKQERVSDCYFDSESGRLVLSEEKTTVEVPIDGGLSVQTVFNVTRTLTTPAITGREAKVARRIAGGQVVEFQFRFGKPDPAQEKDIKIIEAGLGLNAAPRPKELPLVTEVYWQMGLSTPSHTVRSIHLFDVGRDEAEPIEFKERPVTNKAVHTLVFDEFGLESPEGRWFFDGNTAERILKVVIDFESGDSLQLYQLIFVKTLELRSTDELAFPDLQPH